MISICICTYRRPQLLRRCLDSLALQSDTQGFEVVVVDNDRRGSARESVQEMAPQFELRGIGLSYEVEPMQNIALARNRGVKRAQFDAIAFIDDDEAAAPDWLQNLDRTLETTGADVVFGPVDRVFPPDFPKWLRRSSSYDSAVEQVPLVPGATHNCLVRMKTLLLRPGPFRSEFGLTGGEDTELFEWLKDQGCHFVVCREALVHEYVETGREKLEWHVSRAYAGGWQWSKIRADHRGVGAGFLISLRSCVLGSGKALLTSLIAIADLRASLLRLLLALAGQAGKLGYFLGLRFEPYRSER